MTYFYFNAAIVTSQVYKTFDRFYIKIKTDISPILTHNNNSSFK